MIPISPIRAYDSELALFGAKTLGAQSRTKMPIRGRPTQRPRTVPVIPDDPDIIGVVVNVTGVNAFPGSEPTYRRRCPDGSGGG